MVLWLHRNDLLLGFVSFFVLKLGFDVGALKWLVESTSVLFCFLAFVEHICWRSCEE